MKTLLVTAATASLLLCTFGASAEAKTAKGFIEDGIQGDSAEVMMGELASQKGSADGVKQFGRTLKDDHSKAKAEKVSVAQKIGAKVPDGPKKDAQAEYDKLAKMSGPAFDREFVMHMTMDHKKDIKEFEDEAKAKHPETSNLAMMQLPTLRKHLEIVEGLDKEGHPQTH